jgi:signal transduction histidine kinase
MKILVADDDDDSRQVLEVLLKGQKFEVLSASNGDDALSHMFASEPPDIAVLDWMMPGQSGVDLCKRVREVSNDHYTYLILLTARSQQEDVIAGLEAGADDYLVKPYDVKEFLLRVNAGKRLIELQQQLKRQNEVLQDLNYALAHDLKTPLIAISMTTGDALEGVYGEIPKDYKPMLTKTRESVNWLLRLTETMRTLAKFEKASAQMTLSELDFHDLTAKCISELEPLLRSKSIEVKLNASRASTEIIGNGADLQRLIINLLDNAIKFTPEKGTIEIDLKPNAKALSISISDSGPGIPEADRPHLFKRFGTRSGPHRGSGTGLGLYLCKRIVDLHNGSIEYEDHGFKIVLPRSLALDK